ncbi:hypothetical protein SARC_09765, partial [Sphaeroforma arctica JP610]
MEDLKSLVERLEIAVAKMESMGGAGGAPTSAAGNTSDGTDSASVTAFDEIIANQ